MKPLRLLWVTDAWETLDHPRDTTLRLAEEAQRMGARCFIAENRSIELIDGRVHAAISEITGIMHPRTSNLVFRSSAERLPIAGFDHLFYRTDPPVDLSYLLPLQLLSYGVRTKEKRYPKVHSPIESLFYLNEKWAMLYLGKFFPKSLISARSDKLLEFARTLGKTVLKPLYLAQSKGVKVIDTAAADEESLRSIFEEATGGQKIPVILQEFLPGIAEGEIRLWFSGGKLIAAVKKMPRIGESVINMDQGGTLERAKLGTREKKAVASIEKMLRKEKILFAAVDLIDGKITDFNHTSPGLLVPMEELLGENLAKKALAPIFRKRG